MIIDLECEEVLVKKVAVSALKHKLEAAHKIGHTGARMKVPLNYQLLRAHFVGI